MTTAKKPKKDPILSKVDESGSFDYARQQLQKALDRNAILEAQVRARGGKPKSADASFDSLSLPEMVAHALAIGHEASKPLQSVTIDPTGYHYLHPTDRAIPGSYTSAPRRHLRKLERAIEDALARFDDAKEHDWHPPVKARPQRSRCGKRDCSWYGIWVDLWDDRGRAAEFCRGCANLLPVPQQEAS